MQISRRSSALLPPVSSIYMKCLAVCGMIVAVLASSVGTAAASATVSSSVTTIAAQATLRQKHVDVDLTVQFPPATTNPPSSGSGAFDLVHHTGQISLQLPNGIGGGGTVTLLTKSGITYLNLPQLAAGLPGAKAWMISDSSLPAQQQGLGPLNTVLGLMDPVVAIETLLGASKKSTKIDVETVANTRTTHYRTTVDTAAAARHLPRFARADYRKATASFGSTPFPIEVWIDSHGLIRQLRVTLTDSAGAETIGTIQLTTITTGKGEPSSHKKGTAVAPIRVTVPGTNQVAPPTQLAPVDQCLVGTWTAGSNSLSDENSNTNETIVDSGGAGIVRTIGADGTDSWNYNGAATWQGTFSNGVVSVVTLRGISTDQITARNGVEVLSNSSSTLTATIVRNGVSANVNFVNGNSGQYSYTCKANSFTETLPYAGFSPTTWTRS